MPRTIKIAGKPRSVATEDELLAFANEIRQAGGANVLKALLPSERANPAQCLIANALNFGCTVTADPNCERFADGSYKWVMYLPHNLSNEQRKALAKVKGVRLRCQVRLWSEDYDDYYLTLPKHIGNAAEAFDEGMAFKSYIEYE